MSERDTRRDQQDIRDELALLEKYPRGGDKVAGAIATLRWVLGEQEFGAVDWSREILVHGEFA